MRRILYILEAAFWPVWALYYGLKSKPRTGGYLFLVLVAILAVGMFPKRLPGAWGYVEWGVAVFAAAIYVVFGLIYLLVEHGKGDKLLRRFNITIS